MKECPCRYCEDRTIDCHSKCKKYKRWSADNVRIRELRNKKLNENRIIDEDIIRRRRKKNDRKRKN